MDWDKHYERVQLGMTLLIMAMCVIGFVGLALMIIVDVLLNAQGLIVLIVVGLSLAYLAGIVNEQLGIIE